MNGSNRVDSSQQGTTTPSNSDLMVRNNNLGTAGQEGGVVSATATMTITGTDSNPSPQVLTLTLRPPPRVTWYVHTHNI